MSKIWSVFGEYNIYTGCDEFLGYIDSDEYPSLDVMEIARATFPNNEISHVNGKGVIIHADHDVRQAWKN